MMNKVKKYILIVIFLSFFFSINISIVQEPYHPASDILHRKSSIVHLLNVNFMSSLLYAYPNGWSDDILLTPEDMKHRNSPDLDVDGFHFVWVVWDTAILVNGTGEILYSKRDSLGDSLIPETAVSNNASYSILSRIAVDGSNNIQFIWLDETAMGMGVWHAKLANDGSEIVSPHLAVSGNNDLIPLEIALNKYKEINISWDEKSAGYYQVNYTKLDSLGNSVITKIRVSPENIHGLWSGIGVDSFANNHLAYRIDSTTQDQLAYSKLDKDGNILISNEILGFGGIPVIIADRSQNIHMVYADPADPGISIKYLKLDQDANILVGPKTLSVYEDNFTPHMALDSLQYLHVVWSYDNLSDTAGIMYAKLDTLGNFVIPPMPVIYPPYSVYPIESRIAVDSGNHLHLVWMDQRLGSEDIYYKRGENETAVKEIKRLKDKHLLQISVSPNPFTTKTIIEFENLAIKEFNSQLPNSSTPKLMIYDVSGREVKHFLLFPFNFSFSTTVEWDGSDDFGNSLPAGIYFIQFSDAEKDYSLPIILLR